MDPLTGDPAILLQDNQASAIVTVPADPGGAEAIICEMEGIHREAAHSLVYRVFVRHGMKIQRLEIGADPKKDIRASLCYLHNELLYSIDVLPTDGISLAIQSAAPMFVSSDLIDDHQPSVKSPRVSESRDLLILSEDRRFSAR